MNSLKTIYNILMCIEKDPAQRKKGRAILSGIGEKMVDEHIKETTFLRRDTFGVKFLYGNDKFLKIEFHAAISKVSININRNIVYIGVDFI